MLVAIRFSKSSGETAARILCLCSIFWELVLVAQQRPGADAVVGMRPSFFVLNLTSLTGGAIVSHNVAAFVLGIGKMVCLPDLAVLMRRRPDSGGCRQIGP